MRDLVNVNKIAHRCKHPVRPINMIGKSCEAPPPTREKINKSNQIKKTLFKGITIIHELSAHREQLLDFFIIQYYNELQYKL